MEWKAILLPDVFNVLRGRLFRLLRALSYQWREKPFKLKAGGESNVYFDGRQTSLTGEGAVLAGRLFLHLIAAHAPGVVGIGGLTLGADPLVSAVIMAAHLSGHPLQTGFLVRKEAKDHGVTDTVVGGSRMGSGSLVAVCDDVITSGGSMLEGVVGAETRGYRVAIALALVDREENDGLANIRSKVPLAFALFRKSELVTG